MPIKESKEIMQRYFDATCKHLFRQGQRANEDYICRYLTASGLQCAVGCHIPLAEYSKDLEGKGVLDLISKRLLPQSLKNELPKVGEFTFIEFLQALQGVHDTLYAWVSSQDMQKRLSDVADRFGLDKMAAFGWFAWEVTIC
jgi:hypothetical protein